MNKKKIEFANEDNFKSFMSQYKPVENLDEMEDQVPDGTKIADYTIRDVIVVELKTLKTNPAEKMESFFHEVTKRPDFPAIYGELDFRRVVSLLPDGEQIIRRFETVAFRQIESIMREANKQVISTIKTLEMDSRTAGALIIINEFANFFEPDILVDYIAEMLGTEKSPNELRFPYINHVILIQDTHKVKAPIQDGICIPIYHVANDNLPATEISEKAALALHEIFESYSHFNKFKHSVCDNSKELGAIEKLDPPQDKVSLRGQEWIEDQYRKNRYMKNFTDEELIEFGSKVMSICIAMILKDKPLVMDHHQRMQFFRHQIELFEESRLRPFDLRRLDIDPRRYAPQ